MPIGVKPSLPALTKLWRAAVSGGSDAAPAPAQPGGDPRHLPSADMLAQIERHQARVFVLMDSYRNQALGGAEDPAQPERRQALQELIAALRHVFRAEEAMLQRLQHPQHVRQCLVHEALLQDLLQASERMRCAQTPSRLECLHLLDALVVYFVIEDLFRVR